jgi:hypothetical protein
MPNTYDQENPKTFKEKQTVQELVMEAHEYVEDHRTTYDNLTYSSNICYTDRCTQQSHGMH